MNQSKQSFKQSTEQESTTLNKVDQPENNDIDGQPISAPRAVKRVRLLWGVLVLLIALVSSRQEWRRSLVHSSEAAVNTVVFTLLGWSPREWFIWRMRLAGLEQSPLALKWKNAVAQASESPTLINQSYRNLNSFTSDNVEAHIYQLSLERGEKLIWHLSRLDKSSNRLYASLERREAESQQWSTLTELDTKGQQDSRIISVAGDYRLVLQPELFGEADYEIAVARGGSLPFPVKSASQKDIGSGFGVPRDGGARQHHGVDVFVKKGTPVTAVVDGHVRTGTSKLGGKHVWLSSGLVGFWGTRYYYAHLDSFAIESGERVAQGDVLGYVGNTGNARTTPPHLHFGIYSGGPVDPAPFLKPAPQLPAQVID